MALIQQKGTINKKGGIIKKNQTKMLEMITTTVMKNYYMEKQ